MSDHVESVWICDKCGYRHTIGRQNAQPLEWRRVSVSCPPRRIEDQPYMDLCVPCGDALVEYLQGGA